MKRLPGQTGKVYLVGAGPGDAGLITVKGMRCLQEADVIVYDCFVAPRLLQFSKLGARKIDVSKFGDSPAMKQEDINQLLVDLALAGHTITRLQDGDPYLFGQGSEEAVQLQLHGISFEVVPGIPAVVAAPAYAGIPMYRNGCSPWVGIGNMSSNRWHEQSDRGKLLPTAETLLFWMRAVQLRKLVEQLLGSGHAPDTPVALIHRGTGVEQATLVGTLTTIADDVERAKFTAPAVIVIGEAVRARVQLQWAEARPLFGRRILVTRARAQAAELVRRIEALGGEPYELPVIEMRLPESEAQQHALRRVMAQPQRYDWLVLMSVNGVHYWFTHLRQLQADIRQWAHTRIVSVGPKTTDVLRQYGIQPDVIAYPFNQEGIWEALGSFVFPGQRVLLAQAEQSRSWLKETMQGAGLHVEEVDLYVTVLPEQEDMRLLLEMFVQKTIHIVTFTSSSTVTNLLAALRRMGFERPIEPLNDARVACMGEVTARTARDNGLRVDVVAKDSTIDGLVEAICTLATTIG